MTTDPRVDLRRRAAAEHVAAVGVILREAASGTRWVEIPAERPRAERERATLRAMASDAERIWGAALPSATGRIGSAALLVRHEQAWLPVVVANHRVTDPGAGALTSPLATWDPQPDANRTLRRHPADGLRLAHLHRLLKACGHAHPHATGAVIGLDADCMLVHDLAAPTWPGDRSTLDAYDERFAERRAIAADAAAGTVVTAPSRVAECRTCPWWPPCEAELVGRHDVSLVVRGPQTTALRAAGAQTVDALAAWTGEAPPAWPGGEFDDAVALARAWLSGVPLLRRGEVSIQRADVEVDVDMESYLEHGAYLWGTLLTEDDGPGVYRPFVTWAPLPDDDEARSFAEFWAWLQGVRDDAAAHGRSFAAYCYSEQAENRWLVGSARRFAGAPGIPDEAQVRAFIDGPEWVDVYATVARDLLCPGGRGLKVLAPLAGFTWRDAEAGGEASMGWYRRAVGLDGAAPDEGQRTRLLEYNADDVLATRALRDWLSSPAVAALPTVDEL